MGNKKILHLDRINIRPPADDHVLLAADNGQIPFFIDHAEVTRPEPAVLGPGLTRCFLIIVITGTATRPAAPYLAHPSLWPFVPLVIHNLDFRSPDRLARRCETNLTRPLRRRNRH